MSTQRDSFSSHTRKPSLRTTTTDITSTLVGGGGGGKYSSSLSSQQTSPTSIHPPTTTNKPHSSVTTATSTDDSAAQGYDTPSGVYVCPHLLFPSSFLRALFLGTPDHPPLFKFCSQCDTFIFTPTWEAVRNQPRFFNVKLYFLEKFANRHHSAALAPAKFNFKFQHSIKLFSSAGADEMGIPSSSYFTKARVAECMAGLDLAMCPHLRFNSAYVLDAFEPSCYNVLSTDDLANRVEADERSGAAAKCPCRTCTQNDLPSSAVGGGGAGDGGGGGSGGGGGGGGGSAWHINCDMVYTRCWSPYCGVRFMWRLVPRSSGKTRAMVQTLFFRVHRALTGLEEVNGYPSWRDSVVSLEPGKVAEMDRVWAEWTKTADMLERRWLGWTPRREGCVLSVAQSCLRAADRPDPGFVEPETRH
ncbi:MAG: hypothetical protein Q9227_005701 [Pyrenula ochraceoflavens]